MLQDEYDFLNQPTLSIKEDVRFFSTKVKYDLLDVNRNIVGFIKDEVYTFPFNLLKLTKLKFYQKSCLLYLSKDEELLFKVNRISRWRWRWHVTDTTNIILGKILLGISFGCNPKINIDIKGQNDTSIMAIHGFHYTRDFTVKNESHQMIGIIKLISSSHIHTTFEKECTLNERKLMLAVAICLSYYYQQKG